VNDQEDTTSDKKRRVMVGTFNADTGHIETRQVTPEEKLAATITGAAGQTRGKVLLILDAGHLDNRPVDILSIGDDAAVAAAAHQWAISHNPSLDKSLWQKLFTRKSGS
jgi:hypothetical protein